MIQHGPGGAVEEFVEGAEEFFHGDGLGKRGRIPQITHQDDRVYNFAFPARRPARQNALASAFAEIGLQ